MGVGYTGSAGIGYTGSQGSTGFAGSQGSDGNIGYTGSQGYVGSVGPIGLQGGQGEQGPIGYTGSQGAVSLNTAYGFVYTQATDSETWTISHNQDCTGVVFQVYTTTMESIIPNDMTIDNSNQVTISFTAAMSGYAHLILFKPS